jgi:integrase
MAIGKLNALAVSRASKPGNYGDGGGLVLQVRENSKSWVYRYTISGKTREMGLGPLHTIGLADARTAATENRKLVLEGIDPIEARNAKKRAAEAERAKAISFEECARQYIIMNSPAWRSSKHAAQWTATLTTYAYPVIGKLAVGDVDTAHIVKIIEPIWAVKNETASRVRGRIESILDWARVRGFRAGDNPARWKGYLDQVLPQRSKVRKVKHYPSLPFNQLPAFIVALRQMEGVAPLALEFLILTATRSSETIKAPRSELDIKAKVWNIAGHRMKGDIPHRVPLCGRAIEIIEQAAKIAPESQFIFAGAKKDRPLSNAALEAVIDRMNGESDPPTWADENGDAIVPHGFRASLSTWCAEVTAFPPMVTEMALSHAVGSEVIAAYRRKDLFAKRIKLMDAWAGMITAPPKVSDAKIVNFRAAQS